MSLPKGEFWERHRARLLCALSAALLALSFPKTALLPLAWVALVPLFFAIEGTRPREALYLGWFAGTLSGIFQLYWIAGTIARYTDLPALLAALALLLLAALVGLFWGAWAGGLRLLHTRLAVPLAAGAPALWVILEFLRAPLTRFPWNQLGYALVGSSFFSQAADLVGVYGLSALLVMANHALYRLLVLIATARAARPKIESPWRAALWPLSVFFILATALAYGMIRQGRIEALAKAAGRPYRVALIQANIPQSLKWRPGEAEASVRAYEALTREAATAGPLDLIVWPEAAVPFYPEPDQPLLWRIERLSGETGAPILFGAPYREAGRYYNSAFLLGAAATEPSEAAKATRNPLPLQRYDKTVLVPFGEYVPFAHVFFFLDKLTSGGGDFSPGERTLPLDLGGLRLAPLICYEAIFPALVRRFSAAGANLLVNLTNDAWFGTSSAPYQHLAMARLRAIETRSYLVRAANTGISAAVSPTGALISATELETRDWRVVWVGTDLASTLYERWGDWIVILAALVLVGFGIWGKIRRGRA